MYLCSCHIQVMSGSLLFFYRAKVTEMVQSCFVQVVRQAFVTCSDDHGVRLWHFLVNRTPTLRVAMLTMLCFVLSCSHKVRQNGITNCQYLFWGGLEMSSVCRTTWPWIWPVWVWMEDIAGRNITEIAVLEGEQMEFNDDSRKPFAQKSNKI